MKVRVLLHYSGEPTAEHQASLQALANSLTNDKATVEVSCVEKKPDALAAEFTMPTEAQDRAVQKIDHGLHFWCLEAMDSVISFPKDRPRKQSRRKS